MSRRVADVTPRADVLKLLYREDQRVHTPHPDGWTVPRQVAAPDLRPARPPAPQIGAPPTVDARRDVLAAGPRWTAPFLVVGAWAVGLLLWWLLEDARWSVLPVGASAAVPGVVAWTLLATVVLGFAFMNRPFHRWRGGLTGPAVLGASLVVAAVALGVQAAVLGRWDAVFSVTAPGAPGWTAAALIALACFAGVLPAVVGTGGYPFERGTERGVGGVLVADLLAVAIVVVLVHPALSPASAPHALAAAPTVVGWLWCVIVLGAAAPLLWAGWPWAGIANRHLRSAAVVLGTLVGAVPLLWLGRALVPMLANGAARSAPTWSPGLEVGQLAALVVLWTLTLGLLFPALAAGRTPAVRRRLLTVGAVVAAVVSYVVIERLVGTTVLHAPAGGVDSGQWAVLVALVVVTYAVGFGGPGVRRSVEG